PQLTDMIGVEVREQDRLQARARQAQERYFAPRSRPDVHQEEMPAGQHRGARTRALRIGQRRAGATEDYVQLAVVQESVAVAGERARCAAWDETRLNAIASGI